MKFSSLFFILLISLPVISYASNDQVAKPISQLDIKNDAKEMSLLKEQIAVLKAQNEMIQSFQTQSYDALHSLTILLITATFSFTAVLFVFSWFSNFKLNEKQIAGIESKINSITERIGLVDKNLSDTVFSVDQKIVGVEFSLDSKERFMRDQIGTLERDLYYHLVKLKKLETESWLGKKYNLVGFLTSVERIELALKSLNEPLIINSLRDSIECLKELIDSEHIKVGKWFLDKFSLVFDKLFLYQITDESRKEEFNDLVASLKEQLALLEVVE